MGRVVLVCAGKVSVQQGDVAVGVSSLLPHVNPGV